MEQKKIDRINELAKLAKERELTDEEGNKTKLTRWSEDRKLSK